MMLELDNCHTAAGVDHNKYHGMQKMRRFKIKVWLMNTSSIEKYPNNHEHKVNIFSWGNENEAILDMSDVSIILW